MKKNGFASGTAHLRDGLRLLRSHRELWSWCLAPLLLDLTAFVLALVVFVSQLDFLTHGLHQLLATADPQAWYEWLWTGPLRLISWMLRGLFLGLFALTVYFLFTLVGGVLAAPFLDGLSRRVEAIHHGVVVEPTTHGVRAGLMAAARTIFAEARRMLFLLVGFGGFFLLGLIPGLQPVAAAGWLLFTMLFLPLDYTGYLMDRRGFSFRDRRRWIWRNRRSALGFGAMALASFLIPGLNFLCLPWFVCSATLLALDAEN